jgi:hypothetical protein
MKSISASKEKNIKLMIIVLDDMRPRFFETNEKKTITDEDSKFFDEYAELEGRLIAALDEIADDSGTTTVGRFWPSLVQFARS